MATNVVVRHGLLAGQRGNHKRLASRRIGVGVLRGGDFSLRCAPSERSSTSSTTTSMTEDAKERFIEESALDLVRRISFHHQLSQSEKDAYIESTIEDLRRRLQGWPPEPTNSNRSERLDALSASLEDQGSGSIISRRSYPIGDFGETLLVLVEEVTEGNEKRKEKEKSDAEAKCYRIRFYSDSETPMQLHWGVIGTSDKTQSQWMLPPDELRPYSTDCDEEACNTELGGGGPLQMTMVEINRSNPVAGITFVMRQKRGREKGDTWLKAEDGGNFYIPLPTDWVKAAANERKEALHAGYLLEKIAQDTEGTIMYHHTYKIPSGTMIALVKAVHSSYQIEIVVDTNIDAPISLHWGMSTGEFGENSRHLEKTGEDEMVSASGNWVVPPENMRPVYSECVEDSCSTELLGSNLKRAIINAKPMAGVTGLSFVLKIGEDEYVKNGEKDEDFHIPVPAGILQELSYEATKSSEVLLQRVFALGRDGSYGRVLALVSAQSKGETMVEFFSDCPVPLILHWGISRARLGEWTLPDINTMHEPEDSEITAGKACETQFKMAPGQMLKDLLKPSNFSSSSSSSGDSDSDKAGNEKDNENSPLAPFASLQRACLRFKAGSKVMALPFVVRTNPAEEGKQIWFKDHWGNFVLPFKENAPADGIQVVSSTTKEEEIIDKEEFLG